MELIIDFDNIQDSSKKEFLLGTLKFSGIKFRASEKLQTLDEYNNELENANAEIENELHYNGRSFKRNRTMVIVWENNAKQQLKKPTSIFFRILIKTP